MFRVVECGDIVPHRHGVYTSFPSIARDPYTDDVLILFRQAIYHEADPRPAMRAHGLEGCLYVTRLLPDLKSFSMPKMVLHYKNFEPGLIDGTLTTIGDRLLLLVRRYPTEPSVFYTSGNTLSQLDPLTLFPAEKMIKGGAQWGRAIELKESGRLLQVFYGGERAFLEQHYLDKPIPPHYTRPSLFYSDDKGHTWHFLNWISPMFMDEVVTANETALIEEDGVLYVLMRTAKDPKGRLYFSKSQDGGLSWEPPRHSGLRGQAPVFYKMPDGKILLCFRGYLPESDETGGTMSLCRFFPDTESWSEPVVVEPYFGNHYDGGYGDMIWVPEKQQLLMAYYVSNDPETRNPWLRYAWVEIDR